MSTYHVIGSAPDSAAPVICLPGGMQASVYLGDRWDAAAQAHYAAEAEQINGEALRIFNSDGSFDLAATREGLTKVDAPVLLLAGEFDWTTNPVAAAEFADLFPSAQLVVQPGAGRFPWLYAPAAFVTSVAQFLR